MKQQLTTSDRYAVYAHPPYALQDAIRQHQEAHIALIDELNELHTIARSVTRNSFSIHWTDQLQWLSDKARTFLEVLEAHAMWEEDVIFARIRDRYGEDAAPFREMQMTFEQAKRYLQRFFEAARRASVRQREAVEMASYLLLANNVLRKHFEMEEQLLCDFMNTGSAAP